MLKSMTGYGAGSNEYFSVEIQAVNHKFSEIKILTPSFMTFLENKIKEYVQEKVNRGKLYIPINTKNSVTSSFNKFQIDHNLVKAYLDSFRQVGKSFRLKDDLKLSHIIGISNIISKNSDMEIKDKLWEWLKEPLNKAVKGLLSTRISEGKKIETELKLRINNIKELVAEIEKKTPQVILEYQEKLKNRLSTLKIDKEFFDETRLYQEIAIFADKCDITEELVRLKSHIQQFDDTLAVDKPIGRQLEFLAQELHREINTIGSKTGDIKIIQFVLQAKNELEKVREQIQNVE
ncbi:MAG: YicC/YloC family endoribonuclease [bacterium]